MIETTSLFDAAIKQSEREKDVLVFIEDETLEGVKTSQADWMANLEESDVNYATVPGSVLLRNHELYSDWAEQTSGAGDRLSHTANEIDGIMYVFAGAQAAPGADLNSMYAYDIDDDSWTAKTSGASIRQGHTAIVYNGDIYVFGGENSGTEYNDLWHYDVSGDSWTQLFPTGGPPAARFNHHAVIVGSNMYMFGGDSGGATFLDDMWVLNLSTLVWSSLTDADDPISNGVMHYYDGNIFLFGGVTTGSVLSDTVFK